MARAIIMGKNEKKLWVGSKGNPRVYCGECKRVIGIPNETYIYDVGRRIKCPEGDTHVARIVNNKPGESWVKLENRICKYEIRYSPLRLIARIHEWLYEKVFRCGEKTSPLHEWVGQYIVLWFLILSMFIFIAGAMDGWPINPFIKGVLYTIIVMLVLLRICDILIIGISTAYIRQIPAHRLRSVVFSLLGFIQIAIAFSVFYLLVKDKFCPQLGYIEALYLGFVVITSLGYANSVIIDKAVIPQILIIGNILFGIVSLTVLLSVVVQWAGGTPWQKELSLDQVKKEKIEGKEN